LREAARAVLAPASIHWVSGFVAAEGLAFVRAIGSLEIEYRDILPKSCGRSGFDGHWR
jgi:hypothetical protein